MINYYAILGIPATASKTEIRQAYRERAKTLHPDVNPDPGAVNAFQQLKKAYETLSDPLSRRLYDSVYAASLRRPAPAASYVHEPYDYSNVIRTARIWSLVISFAALVLLAEYGLARWTPEAQVEAYRIADITYYGTYQIRTSQGSLELPVRAFHSLQRGDRLQIKATPLFGIVVGIRQSREGEAGFDMRFHPKFGSINPYPLLAVLLLAAGAFNVWKKQSPTRALIAAVIGAWLVLVNLVMLFL